jgi:hypothetical protein
MRGSRNLAILGVLIAFLAIFLAWYPDGSNLLSLYYQNGSVNTAPLSNPSNQLLTIAFILYPIALLVALWTVWTRRSTPWQGMIIAPAVVYLAYQVVEGLGMTLGPELTLAAGVILLGSYLGEWRSPSVYSSHDRPDRRPYRQQGSSRYGRFRLPRRIRAPLWTLFGIWVLMVGALYYGNFPYPQLWYVPDILSVIAGAWLGFRYFSWVANISDRGTLFLVTFGSVILFLFIDFVFVGPYTQATFPFNPSLGISYSASDIGLSSTFAAFGVPLVLFVGLAILFAGYKASRTIFVRYE